MVSEIEVRPGRLESLYVRGMELPYVEFGSTVPALKLVCQGEEYSYWRTVPLKGYGAVLPRYIQELEGEGKRPLLARFGMRIYIYVTGAEPAEAGKPPGR